MKLSLDSIQNAMDYTGISPLELGTYMIELSLLIISYQMITKCYDYIFKNDKNAVPNTWYYWTFANWICIGFLFRYIIRWNFTPLHMTVMITWSIGFLIPSMVVHHKTFGKFGYIISVFENLITYILVLYVNNPLYTMYLGNFGKLMLNSMGHQYVGKVLGNWKNFKPMTFFNFSLRCFLNTGYIVAYMGGAHKNLWFLGIIEFVNIGFIIIFHLIYFVEKAFKKKMD